MDNTREKLIELLQDCMCDYVSAVNYEWWTTYEVEYEALADHLIANGVVISKKETPTTNADRCVCCGAIIPEGSMVCTNCNGVKEGDTDG